MKANKKLGFALGCLLGSCTLNAQVRISDNSEMQALRSTPMEAIYLHTNTSLFFPGEYLYYSLYCANTQTYRLSNISDRAYVQLVDRDGHVYRNQKIQLRGGRGQGDIFIGTDLPSGAYKLIAFTHWMRNAGPDQFFQADVTIVNPYQQDQSALLGSSGMGSEQLTAPKAGQGSAESDGLGLELSSVQLGFREEAVLTVRNYRGNLNHGVFSLSINRMSEIPVPARPTPTAFAGNFQELVREIPQQVGDVVAVPEQRGELLSGRVVYGSDSIPAAGVPVQLSLPGNFFQMHEAQTDRDGRFFTYLTTPYYGNSGVAAVRPSPGISTVPAGEVAIQIYDPAAWAGDLGEFQTIRIDTTYRHEIVRRSVHNQIENSYYSAKPDTVLTPDQVDIFFGEDHDIYNLDEYTRFPTLDETLVEIVQNVWVRRDREGGATLWVRAPDVPSDIVPTTVPPLVAVDGILIRDHEPLLLYDARNIRTIRVMRDKQILGRREYQGVVAIETINQDFFDNPNLSAGTRFAYRPPEIPKKYYQPGPGAEKLPDFRYQLLWVPIISVDSPAREFVFRTSDVPGTYEIRLEGFTSYGKPVALTTYIEVVN